MDGILLVDGYNVINNWPELSELKEQDLSHARDQLAADLSEFQALCGIQVIVVYDAHYVREWNTTRITRVQVIYTKEGKLQTTGLSAMQYNTVWHLKMKKNAAFCNYL